jgi:hypothetical protein
MLTLWEMPKQPKEQEECSLGKYISIFVNGKYPFDFGKKMERMAKPRKGWWNFLLLVNRIK